MKVLQSSGVDLRNVVQKKRIVQQEDVIARLHNEIRPPEEYYAEYKVQLRIKFPKASTAVVDHCVALMAALDTAVAFGLSFGISKFQLCRKEVKLTLVGELVGRDGRRPNPDICKAIRNWPPINNLKDLQSFLGTLNYVRSHAGPAHSRIAHPLRVLLKPEALFPPNDEQRKAINELKTLVIETHLLAIPNEKAAIEAAAAWLAGLPPAGRPYEAGADTSKIAVGGVMGQCEYKDGKLRILLYWSAPLSPAQSQWHPFEQEFWGLLQLKREIVKHFGRVPIAMYTDHGNVTRLEHLPVECIEAKHFRWHSEIAQGGTLLLYRPGTGTLHCLPDGISRNPEYRDDLNTCRLSDWALHRAAITGIQRSIVSGEFEDDKESRGETAPSSAAPRSSPLSENVLFLGPFAITSVVEEKKTEWSMKFSKALNIPLRPTVGDPAFDVPEDIDGKGYWVRPVASKEEARRKLLKKQLYSSIVLALSYVVRYRPRVIMGYEQGGLISACLALQLVTELACRARILTTTEMTAIRSAWSRVAVIIVINPVITPLRTQFELLHEAVPEIKFLQPRGIHRLVIQSNKNYFKKQFGEELASALGVPSWGETEFFGMWSLW